MYPCSPCPVFLKEAFRASSLSAIFWDISTEASSFGVQIYPHSPRCGDIPEQRQERINCLDYPKQHVPEQNTGGTLLIDIGRKEVREARFCAIAVGEALQI